MDRCPRCYEFTFSPVCKCTQYRCWHDFDEGWEHYLYAADREAAAEKYAIHHNEESGDYCMMNGDDTINVTVEQDGKLTLHRVTAEATISYYVRNLSEQTHD